MKRFSIRTLMIVIAILATILALLKNYTFPTLTTLYIAALMFIGWLPSHGRPRVARWGLFASAAWLNLSIFTFFAFYPVVHNSILLLFPSLALVAIVPGVGLAWVVSQPRRPQQIRAALTVVAVTAIPCSMIATHWPLKLAFYVSSSGLDRLADRLEGGGTIVPGEWAGIYRVWASMTDSATGDQVLLTDPDRRGIFGFGRHVGSIGGTFPRERIGSGGWYYIDED
jgi:hypothetical protein